ncbi:hypothetical protein P3T22_005278 [Paraburkholderia sp. GAS348]
MFSGFLTINTSPPKHLTAKLTLCAAVAATLTACGGGGSSTPSSSSTRPAMPTTLSGTVATGAPVSGANVQIVDSTGKSVTVTADAKGNYQVPLTGLTTPFAVFATDPSGIAPPLASVVPAIPANSSAPVIANVTSLTTAAAALVTQSGNPLDLANSQNLSSLVTLAAVSKAVQTLSNATANILSANNLDPKSFDPIATPFTANQTGADAALDAVQVIPATGSAGGFQLISTANPNSSANLALNSGATASSSLPAPPATGAFLAPLMTALTECLGGSSGSCSQAIDASYKDNGFTSFTQAHPSLAASGVSLGVAKILEFMPGTSGKQVLIALPYTTSGGASGFEYTVAQQTANGWDIIGNQQQYNVHIQSFIQRRQTLDNDTWPSNVSRWESGIDIAIPLGAAGTPNPANLASASVTGPGITGTIYYVLPAQAGSSLMSIARAPQTSVPTGGRTSNTQAWGYRWSWQTLPGVTGTFVPSSNNLGQKYAPQPIDVSTVPEYATYTVTFYDASGTQIGQTSVVNPTPNIAATNGANIPWQTLSGDTIHAFLNPNGPQAAAQQTVNVSWSNLVNGANIAPLVTFPEITTQGSAATDNIVGVGQGPASVNASGTYSTSVTAGVNQAGTQTCPSACSFAAFASGITRNLDLSSNYGQISLDAYWGYSE